MVTLNRECKGSATDSVMCLLKRSPDASIPTEQHVRKLMNDPMVNDTMPSCPQTTNTETSKDPEKMFPEINQNKQAQGQMEIVKSAVMNTIEPCIEQTPEEQHSICSVHAFPLDGNVMTPIVDHHPTMMEYSNNETYLRRELDFVTNSLRNSSKHIALLEDELKRLKAETEHGVLVTTPKFQAWRKSLI